MNSPFRIQSLHPRSRSRAGRGGFTLVEILTAVSVLTLMLVMVAQVTSSATSAITSHGKHLDADTEARLIFNRMAIDFSRMLKRTDVDYSAFKQNINTPLNPQTGNDKLAFYSETTGYFSSAPVTAGTAKSDVSLVAYMVANDAYTSTPSLQRMGKGLGWEPNSTATPPLTAVLYLPNTLAANWNLFGTTPLDPDYKSVGSQVFRIEYSYLLKPTSAAKARLSITPWDTTLSHTSVNGFTDVAALVVTIAILDNSSRSLVSSFTNLTSAFPDAVAGTDTASVWNGKVNASTFASTASIPQTAASAVRIYERYFYLDSSQ